MILFSNFGWNIKMHEITKYRFNVNNSNNKYNCVYLCYNKASTVKKKLISFRQYID